MATKLEKAEEESFYEDDFPDVPPPDIVAYNELRSCADLFRMHTQGILELRPEFQRDIVWTPASQTRFIDSLIKQLPIPSMCFALDNKRQKWMVIDGLQRMHSIMKFLEGGDWTLSKLDDIDQVLAGKSVAALKPLNSELHSYYTRVENLTVPITVLRCDFKKSSHLDYLFMIFHRLNAGGARLNNQEIRNCIYGGPFNNLLKELDRNVSWRRLNKMRPGELYRFTKQERILRFFALHDTYKTYSGHLAKFLNDFMKQHRTAGTPFLDEKRELFEKSVDCLFKKALGETSPNKPATIIEAALVGIGRNLAALEAKKPAEVKAMYQKLTEHEHFLEASLTEGLSKKPKVIERLTTAEQIFAG